MNNMNHHHEPKSVAKKENLIWHHQEIQSLFAKIISEINKKLNSGIDDEDILDFIFTALRLLIPYDRIGVALLSEDNRIARLKWVRSRMPIQFLKKNYTAPLDQSSLNEILKTGEPRIINDLLLYSHEHPESQNTKLILKDGIRSNLTCPLKAQGKLVGFVFFSSFQPHTYNSNHKEIFSDIADELSVIIEQGRLYDHFSDSMSKEQSMRMMLHDLKTPLSVIQGYLEIIMCQNWYIDLRPEGKKILGILLRNSSYMVNLLNELSEFLQIGTPPHPIHLEEVQLRNFCLDIATYGRLLAEKKEIRFDSFFDPKLPVFFNFDSQKIRRALDNLFTNAIKFSKRKTQISLTVSLQDGGLCFAVEDHGQGIPETEIPKLFQEFGRTSVRPTEGESSTGLGLAIVRKIVHEHGGRTSVSSQENKGSIFSFWLPNQSIPTVQ